MTQQVEARRQKALDGTGVVVNARGAWMRCRDLALREIKASEERHKAIERRLDEVDLVKRFLEKEHDASREEHDRMEALNETLDKLPGEGDVGAILVDMGMRCGKLGALRGGVPPKKAELQGYFESARKHAAVLRTIRALARSELDNLDNNERGRRGL